MAQRGRTIANNTVARAVAPKRRNLVCIGVMIRASTIGDPNPSTKGLGLRFGCFVMLV